MKSKCNNREKAAAMKMRMAMIKKSRFRFGGYRFLVSWGFFDNVLWLVWTGIYIHALLNPVLYAQSQYLVLLGICFLEAGYFVLRCGWNLFWLARLDFRRFAVQRGVRQLPLLQPNFATFEGSMPSVIKVQMKPLYIGMVLFAWTIPWLAFQPQFPGWGWFVFGFVFISAILFLPIFLFSLTEQSTLKITENGIEKKVGNTVKTVEWSNADSFACYRLPSLIGRPLVIYCELSSQTTRITWKWVVDAQSIGAPWRPAIPDEQYQRQMRALTALVMEKTGLPLYDLSEPWLKRKEEGMPKE
jgi:hypothetical protein